MKLYGACMKKLLALPFLGSWLTSVPGFGQSAERYLTAPRPAELHARPGEFVVGQATRLQISADQTALEILVEDFDNQFNRAIDLIIWPAATNPTTTAHEALSGDLIVFVSVTDAGLGAEGYRVGSTEQRILTEA